MKKLNRYLALAMALMLLVTSAAADGWEGTSEYVNTLPSCYLYLRVGEAIMYMPGATDVYEQPTDQSAIVGQLIENQDVSIDTADEYQMWAYVRGAGIEGWVSAPALIMESVLQNNAVVVSDISGGRITLRTEPTEAAGSLGEYYTGVLCEVLNPTPVYDGQTPYVLVRIGSRMGYMDYNCIRNGISNDWEEVPSIMVRGMQGAKSAIYADADENSEVLDDISNGTYVAVLGVCADEWYHVMCRGVSGFIHSTELAGQLPWNPDAGDTDVGDMDAGDMDAGDMDTGDMGAMDMGTGTAVMLPAGPDALYVVSSQIGNRVNFRTKPSSDGVVLAKYYTGTPVIQLGPEENGYLFISIGHLKGYMDVRFLADDLGERESELICCVVVPAEGAERVAMYRWNEYGSEIVKELYDGETVIMIGVDGDWAHVVYGTTHGFVQRSELYEMTY